MKPGVLLLDSFYYRLGSAAVSLIFNDGRTTVAHVPVYLFLSLFLWVSRLSVQALIGHAIWMVVHLKLFF